MLCTPEYLPFSKYYSPISDNDPVEGEKDVTLLEASHKQDIRHYLHIACRRGFRTGTKPSKATYQLLLLAVQSSNIEPYTMEGYLIVRHLCVSL